MRGRNSREGCEPGDRRERMREKNARKGKEFEVIRPVRGGRFVRAAERCRDEAPARQIAGAARGDVIWPGRARTD